MTALLALDGLAKDWFGVPAVCDVTLAIEPGTTLGLIGENGAGKSTLMNMIGGVVALLSSFFTVHQQTAGVIERFGKFSRIARPGLNLKAPFIERVVARLSAIRTPLPAAKPAIRAATASPPSAGLCRSWNGWRMTNTLL